ncbi:hypothetical protein [Chryseobacterium flavum]|uniref:hypothetical protein n=1 Tax=Chryseobacterium flavum TaxID=415851 RepID=UPI0028AE6259|nr:hypothetical protein [Chryseobacterium flavum]
MRNLILNRISNNIYQRHNKQRKDIQNRCILVNIHEWGGYPLERNKTVSNIPQFECGLKYQLQRFNNAKKKNPLFINVTISDIEKCSDIEYIKSKADNVDPVRNEGMDFSGYSSFYEKIKDKENSYVILSNTSVNAIQEDFLENHIQYMEEHPEVGMLGVSYCTKIIQTFVRNNFTPHLQSFYILTTIDVLREVVELNGKFPGDGIDHKLLLIRNGEIRLSTLVLRLNYKLAIVQENGEVYQFGRNGFMDNSFNAWKLYFGDIRVISKIPNRINPIL